MGIGIADHNRIVGCRPVRIGVGCAAGVSSRAASDSKNQCRERQDMANGTSICKQPHGQCVVVRAVAFGRITEIPVNRNARVPGPSGWNKVAMVVSRIAPSGVTPSARHSETGFQAVWRSRTRLQVGGATSCAVTPLSAEAAGDCRLEPPMVHRCASQPCGSSLVIDARVSARAAPDVPVAIVITIGGGGGRRRWGGTAGCRTLQPNCLAGDRPAHPGRPSSSARSSSAFEQRATPPLPGEVASDRARLECASVNAVVGLMPKIAIAILAGTP